MHPKRDLGDRNAQREAQRRTRFLRTRLAHAGGELKFAQGKIDALPVGQKQPPGWALAAARLSWKTGFGRLEKLDPSNGDKFDRGDMWELFGLFRRLASYAGSRTTGGVSGELSAGPVLLAKGAAKSLASLFRRFMRKMEVKSGGRLQIPTDAELIEETTRSQIGVEGFFAGNGEPEGMKTMTARIYFLIWIFWTELEGRFTAPEIHRWLAVEFGEAPSDKLVEKIVTDLTRDAAEHL